MHVIIVSFLRFYKFTDGSDPKLITHIYHMIAAMDGVYEFLVEYHEDWRAGLRTWLLRLVLMFICMPGLLLHQVCVSSWTSS